MAVGVGESAGKRHGREAGAVREHTVAIDLRLANRYDEPALVRIQDRVEAVRRKRGHHRLAQLSAACELPVVLG